MAKESEPGTIRKFAERAGIAVSFVTLPLGIFFFGKAALAGKVGEMALAGVAVGADGLQIAERNKPMKERSPLNPSRITDWALRGAERFFQRPSTSLAAAAA